MLVIQKRKKKKKKCFGDSCLRRACGHGAERREGGFRADRKDRKSCAALFCRCETMQLASCPRRHDLSIELARRARGRIEPAAVCPPVLLWASQISAKVKGERK